MGGGIGGRKQIYDGDPLSVFSNADGVNANRNWNAGNANPWLGVVLEVISE